MKRTLALFTILSTSLFAQGPLTPPAGPPTPSMKTLDQLSTQVGEVEPRIAVNATNTPGDATSVFHITAPGSYYLTENVTGVSGKDGITIDSSGVTLDLRGFSLLGVSGSGNAIGLGRSVSAISNIAIRNGFLTGFGARGLYTVGNGPVQGVVIEDLVIACTGAAMTFDVSGSLVARRLVVGGGAGGILCIGEGIFSRVEDCHFSNITGQAIRAESVNSCQVSNMTSSISSIISADHVTNCRVDSILGANSLIGIVADEANGCVVSNLLVSGNADLDGILANTVSQCKVSDLTTAGGNIRGIAQRNSNDSGDVQACSVSSLETAGSGAVTGISSGSVQDCQVASIGIGSSTGAVSGIRAISAVAACGARTIGNNAVTATVIGIAVGTNLSTFNQGTITGSDARGIAGKGIIYGLGAGVVSDSSTSEIVQQSAAGLVIVRGIIGQNITNCRVTSVQANGGLPGSGVYASQVIDTLIDTVSNSANNIFQNGIEAGLVKNCRVRAVNGDGIRGSLDNAMVSGCSVQSAGGAGVSVSAGGLVDGNSILSCGTGISTTSTSKAVVRGNHVASCATSYSLGAATHSGPVVTAAGTISSTSPFANFAD